MPMVECFYEGRPLHTIVLSERELSQAAFNKVRLKEKLIGLISHARSDLPDLDVESFDFAIMLEGHHPKVAGTDPDARGTSRGNP